MLHEPTSQGRGELRELGSRFFGYIIPAQTLAEVEEGLAQLHKKYPDATHIWPMPTASARMDHISAPPMTGSRNTQPAFQS